MGRLRNCCRFTLFLLGLIFLSSQLLIAQEIHPPASERSSKQKSKPAEIIDDLDSIGTRNISGRRIGNWYSLDREIQMGREYAYEVEGSTKPLRDPFIAEYVNRVGQNLVRNSDAKVPFTIKVLDSEEVNAFALPGGFLYVNSGLIIATEDEAELAGIMAHEVAHVAARHATRQITRSRVFDLASIALIAVGGGIVAAARGMVGPLSTMKFSRNFESEADYLAVEYVYKAGYDPTALISILERLQLQEKRSQGAIAKAFSTHPETGDRINKMQKEIARILPARPDYLVSTSDFDEVRSRLLSRVTKLNRKGNAGRPTLRRRGNADGTATPSDDTPMLNRP